MIKRVFTNKNLFLLLFILALIFNFLALDKYWAPFDEGIVTVAAWRVTTGEIPYKDFFVALYPPGQFYLLAFLYKIFGVSLVTGRVCASFAQAFLVMCVFLITRHLAKKNSYALIAWLVSLSCAGPRLGVIPSPIWPGMAFALFSLYLFMRYVEDGNINYLAYSGLALGSSVLFRHDIGIFMFVSILAGLGIYKRGVKEILCLAASSLVFPFAVFTYLFFKSASRDVFESLILFAFVHGKTAVLPFPWPCLDFNMIFHKSLHFINVNQYYIPLLIYLSVFAYLVRTFLKKRAYRKTEIALVSLLLFGLLSFNQTRIRTDPQHLLSSIYPAIALFGFLLSKAGFQRAKKNAANFFFLLFVSFVFFLLFLLTVKNTDKFFKNVLRKPFINSVIMTEFDRGSVCIPEEERDDFVNTISFLKENTSPSERIYVGNAAHWKDDFGGSTIIYFLAERLPSTKYYEILPGLITQEKVQREIVDSLGRKNVKLIVLQDIEPESHVAPEGRVTLLDDYIQAHFKLAKKFGKYGIYAKR